MRRLFLLLASINSNLLSIIFDHVDVLMPSPPLIAFSVKYLVVDTVYVFTVDLPDNCPVELICCSPLQSLVLRLRTIYVPAFIDIAQIPDYCPVEVTGTGGRSPVNVR
jgi:hypothetical protein